MSKVTLSALHIYPVKSLGGLTLDSVAVTPKGPLMDRRYMLVDAAGRFVSQRKYPALALVKTALTATGLTITFPKSKALFIPLNTDVPNCDVSIWDDQCRAVDQGEEAALAFSDYLDQKIRLVFIPDSVVRPVSSKYAPRPSDQVGFADGYPFLVISTASLEDLNTRLSAPVLMDRFRPNIVISGCKPYEEDSWKQIRIGEIVFDLVKPCGRCVVTCVDQATGESGGVEPLKTLASYRKREKGNIIFGQNAVHAQCGTLHRGDRVEVIA